MSATQTVIESERSPLYRSATLGVWRATATGALALSTLFALCWAGAVVVNLPVTHAFIPLFTAADMRSAAALAEGVGASLAFGAVAGALIALFYNLFAGLERR